MESVPGGKLTLPDLVLLNDYEGNWDTYLNVLYGFFKKDFIDEKTKYEGKKIGLKKHPVEKGKEATFWHIISDGKDENNRVPDLRRCERIKWIKEIIKNCKHQEIKVWRNKRKNKENICICYGKWEYLVVLAIRKGYLILWTAYPVNHTHTKEKLKKEFSKFSKKQIPPKGGIVTPSTLGR